MTFRGRLTVAAAAAVAVAILIASAVTFVVVRTQLRSALDSSLRELAAEAKVTFPTPDVVRVKFPPSLFGGATGYGQVIGPEGVRTRASDRPIPASAAALQVAAGARGHLFEETTVSGVHLRVYTTRLSTLPAQLALQVARPLTDVDQALRRLATILGLVSVAGVALAAALGFAVSRTAARPITALTEAAEHVTETGDLSRRIEVTGEDEVGRLASSFNGMLAALRSSQEAQGRLVADASHELRTPLTSLRTNIDVLTSGKELPPADRARLLQDVRAQIAELTNLVGDLVEAGRGSEPSGLVQDIPLDDLARAAIARARPRADARGIRFAEALSPTIVMGVVDRLERAMVNLLDNATKFSPDGGIVEVGTADGKFVVRDHGPGIAPNDLPHVFERFYRSDAARGTPGSGLGLAIVRQVAQTNGGTVEAANAPDGGAVFRLRLRVATSDTGAGHDGVDGVGGTAPGSAEPSAPAMSDRDVSLA